MINQNTRIVAIAAMTKYLQHNGLEKTASADCCEYSVMLLDDMRSRIPQENKVEFEKVALLQQMGDWWNKQDKNTQNSWLYGGAGALMGGVAGGFGGGAGGILPGMAMGAAAGGLGGYYGNETFGDLAKTFWQYMNKGKVDAVGKIIEQKDSAGKPLNNWLVGHTKYEQGKQPVYTNYITPQEGP